MNTKDEAIVPLDFWGVRGLWAKLELVRNTTSSIYSRRLYV